MSKWLATPTPSPRTTCARPAPSPKASSPTTACSRSSWRCFNAANSTGSASPTRRLPGSKPKPSSPDAQPEKFMEAAIDRIMQTYALLLNRSASATDEAREKVTDYVKTLFEAGEKDTHRLTVCGLTYLRQLDGSTDPVKAGFTGL